MTAKSDGNDGRLILLTGPSCMGKTPLVRALKRFYPDLYGCMSRLMLFSSRALRPGEVDNVDFHQRSRAKIENLRANDRYLVVENRNDLQALDLEQLLANLRSREVLFEGNPTAARRLLEEPRLSNVSKLSIFLAPLSKSELVDLKASEHGSKLPQLVKEMMHRKLLRRAANLGTELSPERLADLELRAAHAYPEMQQAWRFDYVIPNHDGEDSDNWESLEMPVGDARTALMAFAGLLQGKVSPQVENWDKDLLTEPFTQHESFASSAR